MHSNTRINKVSTKSSIPLLQSGGRKMMYSESGNASSDHGGVETYQQGVSEGDMQSNNENDITERKYVSGTRTMMHSTTETVNRSHVKGRMDYQGASEGESQSIKGGFAEHDDISGGRTVMYSSSGTLTSSQAAGKMYRHGVVEGGMRISKDSGFGELDNASQSGNEADVNLVKTLEFQIELNENDEKALKEELLHIFERERTTLEVYFKRKMEDVLRGFRSRQMEWDEVSRAEKAELERNMSMEKMEMQKNFAEEIDKLTQSFNEERLQLEQYYQGQLKDLREQLATGQREMMENFAKEKIELKEKLEAEYQVMLNRETSHEKQEAIREKSEMEACFKKEKLEIERNFNLRLTESETNLQRVKAEFESNLTQERIRMETECQEKIRQFEEMLQEERLLRLDVEKQLDQEKEKYSNGELSNKKENERLKGEVDTLRLEVEEKNRINVEMKSFEENVTRKGRDGLSGKLKDDFEKLLADHKMELDKTYHREKEVIDQTLQAERRQMKEEIDREKEQIKSEKDEIVRTKEKLRLEGQAQIGRQRQQRGDNEWASLPSGNQQTERSGEVDKGMMPTQRMTDNERLESQLARHQIGNVSGTVEMTTDSLQLPGDGSDAKGRPYWQLHQQPHQQQQEQTQQPDQDGVWTRASPDPYIAQQGVTGNHQQPAGGVYNLKYDAIRQPYSQASFEYHKKEGLPSNHTVPKGIGARSSEEPSTRSNSMYLVPPEDESALRFEINALKSENEGLKAKVTALEENIDLHKKYKKEAKAEMERLLKGNQDNDLKIQTLSSHVEELGKKDSKKENAKGQENEDHVKTHNYEKRGKTPEKNDDRHLEGTLRGLEARAVRAEKTTKEYDANIRLTEERRREKIREDITDSHYGQRDQRNASRQKVWNIYCAFAKSSFQDVFITKV